MTNVVYNFQKFQFFQSGSGSLSNMISPKFCDILCNNSNIPLDPFGKYEQPFTSIGPNIVKEGFVKGKSSADTQLKSNNPEK